MINKIYINIDNDLCSPLAIPLIMGGIENTTNKKNVEKFVNC